MNLQGRNLTTDLTGEDVKRLQQELRLLGFTLPVDETRRALFGNGTKEAVATFQRGHRLPATGMVDETTARAINAAFDALPPERSDEFMVRGVVRTAAGQPAPDVRVQALAKVMRGVPPQLGASVSAADGYYEIYYTRAQFPNPAKRSPDLIVRTVGADDSILVIMPVLFNAPPVATVDVTMPAVVEPPASLFEKIGKAVEPLSEGLQIADLTEDEQHQDISFLAGKTGLTKALLIRFVLAYKLARQGIQPEFWFALLGGSLFQQAPQQSLSDQLATILDMLSSVDATTVRRALTRSFTQQEISERLREKVTEWSEAFLEFAAHRSVSETAGPTFVKLALADARITDAQKQIKFARLFNQHGELTPALLNALTKDHTFSRAEIDDLHTSFRLAELTQGDFSIVKRLKEEFAIRQPEKIRTLAKQSEMAWMKWVGDRYVAGNIKLPITLGEIPGLVKVPDAEVYAKMLERQFREAFPTTAFTGGLERALGNGGAHGLHYAEALGKFLDQHENFELLNTPVDDFFKNSVHPDFQSLAQDENFRLEVKAIQRVFKLAPTFEATEALLADGLHSAQKIYRMGETQFVRRYSNRAGFTPESARRAWSRATDTHAAVLTIVADLKALEGNALPFVLKNGNEALTTSATWNNLFQTGDQCECEPCRSVLSPAAYFADLLMFLKDRQAADPDDAGATVKDILFRRRPDLGFLELDCTNALTELPYIDVVCEVLENVIDKEDKNALELTGFTAMPTDAAAANAMVAQVFQAAFVDQANVHKEKINLGDAFSLSQVNPTDPNQWVVHGDNATYLLQKKSRSLNFFATLLRNTKASAAELRSYPAYVNPQAYAKLCQACYPATLPFDLFAEEVRAAFQKCNLKRWDLMRTLRSATPPNNPSAGDIAAEYFGISVAPAAPFDEKRLILLADPTIAGQQKLWGETDNLLWLNKVGNVKNFLQKSGLEYNELLALLDLKFINPAGDIAIYHLDPSCDLDKKIIEPLDATKLDRIYRFLRLWRKLNGWKMWELDLVIRQRCIGNWVLDEQFLVNLFYFNELKSKLGNKTTIEQVLALFVNLNIETRFTKQHEKREDALYQKLFLNKKLIQPLDPAFALDPRTGDLLAGQKLIDHQSVLLAALGIRETDLALLIKAPEGSSYRLDNRLTLTNLSFLWRHAWLAKQLKFTIEEWRVLLKLFQEDLLIFTSPQAANTFLQKIQQLKASGFTVDELNWLLAADRSVKAAVKEADAAHFLTALRKELQAVQAEYSMALPTDVASLTALLTSLLQKLNRDEAATQFFIATLRDEVSLETPVTGLPAFFADFPPIIKRNIRIRYEKAEAQAAILRFTGLMTAAERATLLSAPELADVTNMGAYREAISDLFTRPRLALRFFEPLFTTQLANLPAAVDFKNLSDPKLVLKISYDAEQRLLCCAGILSRQEKAALEALAADEDYRNAVNTLFTQPLMAAFPSERIWLQEPDLQFPLRAPNALTTVVPDDDNNLVKNLTTATAKALTYLLKVSAENTVVQQVSTQLALTPALTRLLLTHYHRLPEPLLTHLTVALPRTTGVVDYATLPATFEGWYWANRMALLCRKWKITLPELEKIITLTEGAQLLDFLSLPLNEHGAVAPIERWLRTSRLFALRDSLPETTLTLLEVMAKLNTGTYPSVEAFAADVELVNDAWLATDVETLVGSLDLVYPTDYLFVESWERLRRVFYFLDNLNAHAATVVTFATSAMNDTHAKTLKELLRAKFGAENWLTLSAEIQDALRERKRDALAAYLLSQPQPADAPSGKWENMNDLYAYYLLDVEMSACQLTSRLVQGSGSVQLFVQRCFMGLEPDVIVQADGDDGDSAWRWWQWMRKYRVWEANRKVFLWPENWIEPELKKDRSSFFKDLENALLQNEVNQYTVETAFSNYLEKLDGVAQLEIAGFYQEDDADNTILHVFGRTMGAEPHIYYYRRFDYRQWTPWEKVDLDIQGDYLIPAVVNRRLFLFWPVFTEIPDETGNDTVNLPTANDRTFTPDKTKKKLKLQMAVSDYRQGKWSPKKVSTDFAKSDPYDGEIIKNHYLFLPIDMSEVNGHFMILYTGYSIAHDDSVTSTLAVMNSDMNKAFEISGCKGILELTDLTEIASTIGFAFNPEYASISNFPIFMKWVELSSRNDKPEDDFAIESSLLPTRSSTRILDRTPGIFKVTPPWHLSYMDKLLCDGQLAPSPGGKPNEILIGSWLPFFYCDNQHTFFVLPSPYLGTPETVIRFGNGANREYYPEIKAKLRQQEKDHEKLVQTYLDNIDLSTLTPQQRQQIEQFLSQAFPEQMLPPYTDKQGMALAMRYLMRHVHNTLGKLSLEQFQNRQFHFKNYYHPFVCDFAKLVYNPLKGIPALMSRETQLKSSDFRFFNIYQPSDVVVQLSHDPNDHLSPFYPKEDVDFSPDGAYSSYNWELFFHAPLLIANALSKNQRFEEARDWYHFIFNPIGVASQTPGGSVMSKYWITKPFFETTEKDYIQQRIDNILRMLAGDTSLSDKAAKDALEAQVQDWRTNPFEPHRLANYRMVAYQKTVVMKYLDNLIAWGDYLFRQDSMESINEATQLYILAAEILGTRPKRIPPQAKPALESFNELETAFDKFSNALTQVENLAPVMPGRRSDGADSVPLPMLYFSIPPNDRMLSYWDTVADRLYKIRHCMNIEGMVRQLALFEPPIDPAALVKAVAGGVDISSALADLNAPLPLYRFNILLQKANEVCNDVKALGSALLSALEKKDAEAMGLLRQGQEIWLLEAVKVVREKQIDEAKENAEGIRRSRTTVEERRNFYRDVEKVSGWETASMLTHGVGILSEVAATVLNATAGTSHWLPDVTVGVSGLGSPVATIKSGGTNVGDSAFNWAAFFSGLGGILHSGANLMATQASNERRWEDWKLQERLSDKELLQIDKQIAAAELRIAIAQKELDNHVIQIENAKAIDEFMRAKYTNQELYQWQIGQISGVYFQSYKLAYDLAKRAERCLRFELGLQDSSYIQFGYWDSLKKGLLAGEKLQYDLRRLETAYLEQNRRELEMTKHISLVLLDPLALVKLRETGRCFLHLPEEIFDLDYPGHYFRRIKSVSITLPCVAGPYTTISCTLRLLKNSIRTNITNGDNGYPRNTDDQGLPADDSRFIENNIPVKAIAASSAQNDSGVFELSFRDERYLPFEGAGVISEWSLALFNDSANSDFGKPLRQFDYSTISDAILHVKYTAREDAGAFKNGAIAHLRDYFSQDGAAYALQMFSLRQDFPTEWYRFATTATASSDHTQSFSLAKERFPFFCQGQMLTITGIDLFGVPKEDALETNPPGFNLALTGPGPAGTIGLMDGAPIGRLLHKTATLNEGIEVLSTKNQKGATDWTFKVNADASASLERLDDLLIVCHYKVEAHQ